MDNFVLKSINHDYCLAYEKQLVARLSSRCRSLNDLLFLYYSIVPLTILFGLSGMSSETPVQSCCEISWFKDHAEKNSSHSVT